MACRDLLGWPVRNSESRTVSGPAACDAYVACPETCHETLSFSYIVGPCEDWMSDKSVCRCMVGTYISMQKD